MEKVIQKQIIDVIEKLNGSKITTRNRNRENVTARAVYVKLCKDIFPHLSLNKIAKPINRDHATVLHMMRSIEDHLSNDNYYINLYKKATLIINADIISTGNVKEMSYLDSLEERIVSMSNALIDKNTEIEDLKDRLTNSKYKDFDIMDDKLLSQFIETRLKPFLKLNYGNKQTI